MQTTKRQTYLAYFKSGIQPKYAVETKKCGAHMLKMLSPNACKIG